MVRCELSVAGVVEVREGDLILSTNLLMNDDFINVIELVPVFVVRVHVPIQGFEFRSSRDGHVERFCGEKRRFYRKGSSNCDQADPREAFCRVDKD